MAVPLSAATLHDPHVGTACPRGYVGTWHFVNNQTEGASFYGTLYLNVDNGGFVAYTADKKNRNVQHWTVSGGNTLTDAWTNLPGKLVLSDYTCRRVKKGSG